MEDFSFYVLIWIILQEEGGFVLAFVCGYQSATFSVYGVDYVDYDSTNT